MELAVGEHPEDSQAFISKFLPVPKFLIRWVVGRMLCGMWRAKIKEPLYRKCDPLEFAKEVAAAIGEKQFFHGSSPGHVDISFYGTLAPMYVTCPSVVSL